MPTYEYECESCDNKFELFQQMIDKPLEKCPECGGKVVRLIGAGGGLIFKGAGFHANDYSRSTCPVSDKGETTPCCSGECPVKS